jgi:hypothetical protein
MQFTRHARQIAAAAALTSAAILVPAVALAASGSTSAPQSSSVSRCFTSQLTDWIGVPGEGSAGSTFYELEISNVSRHTCTLFGYPGVSAVRGGHQLGSAASRDTSDPDTLIRLAPGATAHAIVQITDVTNFSPGACRPAGATGLRVYAPNAFASIVVPFSFQGCSRRGPLYLHVTATVAGTGIPGHSF